MKLCLVMPPFWPAELPPLGISSLKEYLKQLGHDVTLLDMNTDERVVKLARDLIKRDAIPLEYWPVFLRGLTFDHKKSFSDDNIETINKALKHNQLPVLQKRRVAEVLDELQQVIFQTALKKSRF